MTQTAFRTLDQAGDLSGKRVLVRVDFNVPMQDGRVTDDTRLRAALPTIRALTQKGARVVLLAHFDRPKGKRVPSMSLKPVVEPLAAILKASVAFADDCTGPGAKSVVDALPPGGVALLENVRFHAGEEANEAAFANALAANGDLYVDDAFSAAHRAHASTEAIARILPAYAGLNMARELEHLDKALGTPRRPVMGIVGGSKISSKLDLLKNLVAKLDRLAIGGGMANTFLFAQGWDVGASYCEKELAQTAREIMHIAGQNHCELLLPIDVGGLYRSLDGGAHWEVCMTGWDARGANAFAIDPRNARRAVGVASNSMEWDPNWGPSPHGLYLSTDKASSWKHVLAATPGVGGTVAYDAHSYDAARGYCLAAYYLSPHQGLFRSGDGGGRLRKRPAHA